MADKKRNTKDPEELVETGSFRVDRRRALQKLRDYQLPRGPRGFLSWMRCASSGGASRIAVIVGRGHLSLRFDGRPFSQADLRDPYHALFSGDDERGRHFALALLWSWRAGARDIRIYSSGLSLRALSLSEEVLESLETPSPATVIELAGVEAGLSREFLVEACALSEPTVELNGRALERDEEMVWTPYRFRRGTLRGSLSIPDIEAAENGITALFVQGAHVADVELSGARLPFKARVNDDRFRLNASLTKVVKDGRLRAALDALRERYSDFLVHAAREQRRLAPEIGTMLVDSGRLRAEWTRLFDFDWSNDAPPAAARRPWHLPRSKRLRVHMAARAAAWLRGVTEGMSQGYSRGPRNAAEKALWAAPLIFDVRGRPLSLDCLAREDAGPRIRFSTRRRVPRGESECVVWAMTRRDAIWLTKIAKRGALDVTRELPWAW